MATKKLIEVALPLEEINKESIREKSIRHGHPSTLHLWWARRPLAAARAVIWSSLVDDPSSHPEQFPTEGEQAKERERLFGILKRLVVWENSNNPDVLREAKEEIMKSTGGNPPALLDPFAGGGAIPLEAQRLGLEAHAHDLNPVAVMINKAMIEIPPRFANRPPVNPVFRTETKGSEDKQYRGAMGLAADVKYYGEWMKQEAFKRIGHLYPKVEILEKNKVKEVPVIAWLWARTVKCPNPACGCEMPLVRSFTISKKNGNEAYIVPSECGDHFTYKVVYGKVKDSGTVVRTGATCLKCGGNVDFDYIRAEGRAGCIHSDLMAVVGEGERNRVYVSPSQAQKDIADLPIPENVPMTDLPEKALGFRVRVYGMDQHYKLFTPRQLTALTTFSDLVAEAQVVAEKDALAAGLPDDGIALADGGSGAKAYGQAVGVYLAFAVDRAADAWSSLVSWRNTVEASRNTFARQALPMVWDYTEVNPFSRSCGNWDGACLMWIEKVITSFSGAEKGIATQFDAQKNCGFDRNIMVSTDPPYYDNIGYADLSDYFYVWMRQSLRNTYPSLFRTMLVPKAEELIATPYRHNNSVEEARDFFENGMVSACKQIYQYTRDDVPVTIYYAYKQSDTDEDDEEGIAQTASTGWETMLNAIIQAGFSITGTWPMRTEREGRTVSNGTNSLASSIVLVCRKRPADAPVTTRRALIQEIKQELKPALNKLRGSNIAPVDLQQAAIGPGMGIFSKYSQVLDADGKPMTVRAALAEINRQVDEYFNDTDAELDRETRFCVELFRQFEYGKVIYGQAEVLATAKAVSIPAMDKQGILEAKGGIVRLLERKELNAEPDRAGRCCWLQTQQLVKAMDEGGLSGAVQLASLLDDCGEEAKDLAYRLYTICDRRGNSREANAYNTLVQNWPDIRTGALKLKSDNAKPEQITMQF